MKNDYISHLAKQLFNTERGVSLFINKEGLINNFQIKCHAFWTNIINNCIIPIDVSNAVNGTDDLGRKYLTNDTNTFVNLTRELILKMIYDDSGNRFYDLDNLDPTTNLYKVPFLVDDKISFLLTIHSDPNQTSIIGEKPGRPVNDRVYKISLRVVI
jgi:hypothetical protein